MPARLAPTFAAPAASKLGSARARRRRHAPSLTPGPARNAQREAGLPDAVPHALRHRRRGAVARARHRRQRGDLLAYRPGAPQAVARAGAATAGEPHQPGAQLRHDVVQHVRRVRRDLQLPDVQGPRARAAGAHRAGRVPDREREPGHAGRAVDGRGGAGLGLLLPHPGAEARAGPPAGPRGRRDDRGGVRRRAELRVLARPPGRRSLGAGPHHRGQRPEPGHRGRGAARLRRHDVRHGSAGVHPAVHGRPGDARVRQVPEPARVLAVPVRALEAGRHARPGAERPQRHLRAHPERRRSAAPGGHEPGDAGAVQGQADEGAARLPRPEPGARRGHDPAHHAVRRHGGGAAHCLRQHRQPAPGAGRRARQGDGRAPRARRRAPPPGGAAADRVGDPGRDGGRAEPGRGRPHAQAAGRAPARRGGDRHAVRAPARRRGVQRPAGDRHGPAVRAVPRPAQHPLQPGGRHPRQRRPDLRAPRGGAVPQCPGDGADRPGQRAADLGRPVPQEPGERRARGPGLPGGRPRDVRHLAVPERLRQRALGPAVPAGGGRGVAAAGGHGGHRVHGAAGGGQQLGHRRLGRGIPRGARRGPQQPLQRGRGGLFPHPGHPGAAGARVHHGRRRGDAARRRRQPDLREAVPPGGEPGRQVHVRRVGGLAQHPDRGPGEEREVQLGEGRGPAAVLYAVAAGPRRRLPELLRAHRGAGRAAAPGHSRAPEAPGPHGPAGRHQDDAAADPRQRVPRPVDQHPLGGVRGPGHAARRGGAVRRAGLHGAAAHPRDRHPHGARGRRRPGPRPGRAAGGRDERDRGRRGHRPGPRPGAAAAVAALPAGG